MRLTIAQVEPPRPGAPKRTLELDGSLAPIDSLGYGIEQRVELEWIPGSRVPAIQMSGAEYDPTEIRFTWKGRRFSPGEAVIDGREVGTIDELVDIVTSLVDDTALVEVTWRGRSRKAVLKSFKPEEGSLAEAECVLTVMWVESPTPRASRPPYGNVAAPMSLAEKLEGRLDDALGTVEQTISTLSESTIRIVNSRLIPITTWMRQPFEAATLAAARCRVTIARIRASANSLANLRQPVNGVIHAIAGSLSELSGFVDDLATAVDVPVSRIAQTDEAGQQIRASLWQAEMARGAREVRHVASLELRAYRPESDVLAIHEGVEGDTIWSVSRRFYGSPDHGPDIARRNNLISAHLRPGQRVVIPVLPGAA